MEPSGKYYFLKIHLQPVGFAPLGKSTKIHVWFLEIESISTLIASFQSFASEKEIA